MITERYFERICAEGNIDIVNSAIREMEKVVTVNGHRYKRNYRNYWNWGLHRACKGGHIDIINLMIKKGAKALNWGLYEACEYGHLDAIKLMIEHGADDLNVGLRIACRQRHLNVIELLFKNGAYDWHHMTVQLFDQIFDSVDSNIAKLIIEKKVNIENYLKYSKDKTKIFKLLELGLPIDKLKDVHGFDNLVKDIRQRRNIIRHFMFGHLIKDLIGIITEYITD